MKIKKDQRAQAIDNGLKINVLLANYFSRIDKKRLDDYIKLFNK